MEKTLLEITLKVIDTDNDGTITELSYNKGVAEKQACNVLREYLEPTLHETVEQWELRTGEVYPEDAPVWVNSPNFPPYLGLYEGMKIKKHWCIVATSKGKPKL